MPYLTLSDKISQNSAHLKASSQKNFQILENFQINFKEILRKSKHTLHFIVSIRNLLKLNERFKIPLGSFEAIFVEVLQNFIESHLKFGLISQF